MGNSLGGKRATKVMKINGETMKFKKPIQAGEITRDYPGHVLLDSESVKNLGIRAKPLEAQQELKPKKLYFLVELPKFGGETEKKVTRRVRSGIQMSAKDRLESLMLAKRSVSDLTMMKSSSSSEVVVVGDNSPADRVTRLKMRLPKKEVEKLMMQSRDDAEAAHKIVDLYLAHKGNGDGCHGGGGGGRGGGGGIVKSSTKKRVGFMPISEGEIQLAVAS